MKELTADGIPVTVTCRVLKLARQPYYRWLSHPVADAVLEEALRANALFDAHRDDPEFGYRFLADEARGSGAAMADRTAWRICRDNSWWSVFGKRRSTAKKAGPPVHDDLVRRDFTADGPNRARLDRGRGRPSGCGRSLLGPAGQPGRPHPAGPARHRDRGCWLCRGSRPGVQAEPDRTATAVRPAYPLVVGSACVRGCTGRGVGDHGPAAAPNRRYTTRQRNVKQQVEVVRTALAAGAGVGAAITVLLAFRRQHHHEEATERTEYDASERRINELYIKAVEQLGSAQAPVRLGGLYTLERLGQAAADHRQNIVDVICAYLRMPYMPPPPWWPVSRFRRAARELIGRKADNQRHQELQVRNTAELILLAHLCDYRPPDQRETTPADAQFWDGMGINLNHATLTYFDFNRLHITWASFAHATFTSQAWFQCATVTDGARFDGATFTSYASFDGATFNYDARFDSARFTSIASFDDATFNHGASRTDARALLTTPDGIPVNHAWPTGWEVQPTADGWGTLNEI